MPKKNYTNDELTALIAETKQELAAEAQKELDRLKKGEESAPEKEESSASSASAPEGSSSEGSSAPAPDAPPADPASAPAPAPAADPAAPAEAPGSATPGAPDMATLVAAYSQLAPADLQAHAQALQQVMASQQPAAPAPAPAPVPAPAAPPAAPMAAEGSKPVDPAAAMAFKSMKEMEDKLAKTQEELDKQSKGLETLTKAVELFFRKPQRKAVTGKDLVKSEEPAVDFRKLGKKELMAKVNKIASSPELKKSERALINSFVKGQVKVEDLAPLFEKK